MAHTYPIVTIFGGSGFLGRSIVQDIAKLGYSIRIASRTPQAAYELRTAGVVGQVVPELCSYSIEDINRLVKGSDYVINLVGILAQSGKNSFDRIQKQIPSNIAKACAAYDVKRFIQLSALGVDDNTSQYARTKKAAEEIILDVCPMATILRPSIVFGPGDDFFNRFAKMAQIAPALPLIGGGKTKFQPVYVGDVAQAVMQCLTEGADIFEGEIIELGGPEIVTFKQCLERMFKYTKQPKPLANLPFFMAKPMGAVFQALPIKPFTKDQVISLTFDNVVTGRYKTFADLDIKPTGLASVLPNYLERYVPGGKFGTMKAKDA